MQEALGGSLHPASRDICTAHSHQTLVQGQAPWASMEWRGTGHRLQHGTVCDCVNSLKTQQLHCRYIWETFRAAETGS